MPEVINVHEFAFVKRPHGNVMRSLPLTLNYANNKGGKRQFLLLSFPLSSVNCGFLLC